MNTKTPFEMLRNDARAVIASAGITEQDAKRAEYYAGAGDREAQFRHALICQARADFVGAAKWYGTASEGSPVHAAAAYNMGSLVRHGAGVEASPTRAIAYFTKSGDAGLNIGYLEAGRLMVSQGDFKNALKMLKKAYDVKGKDAGEAERISASILFQNCTGVTSDPKQATALHDRAIAKGNAQAMLEKGERLLTSDDGDRHEGLVLLAQAARRKLPGALETLRQAQSQLADQPRVQPSQTPPGYLN